MTHPSTQTSLKQGYASQKQKKKKANYSKMSNIQSEDVTINHKQ